MRFRNSLVRAVGAALSAVFDNRGTFWPIVREPFTGAWQRNREIRVESVLAHHAVYACVTRIAQDIGKLRPKLVEQDENGIWSETESPTFTRVLKRPNRFQNHIQFKEAWTISKLLTGNTYALKDWDGRDAVRALYILDPSRVTVLVSPDGEVFYSLKQDNLSGQTESETVVPADWIVHDRTNCLFHPLVGTSPIFACGAAADMGITIERNSSAFFANGSNPSGLLSFAVPLSPAKAKEHSENWNSQFQGGSSGRVAMLGDGATYTAMRMSATDSQLLGLLEWTAETVCACFHVPPFKAGIGDMPTYSNGEILNLAYYTDCLQALIEQFELCMDEALGLTVEQGGRMLGVELDLDGLLRMDQASQVKSLAEGVGGGIFAPDEARRKLDLKPVAGGSTPYMQQQNYSLAALDRRDSQEAAETADVQGEALNGAQITALQGLVVSASSGEIPIDTLEAIIGAAFPLLTVEEVAGIVTPIKLARPALTTEPLPKLLPSPEPTEPEEDERSGWANALMREFFRATVALEVMKASPEFRSAQAPALPAPESQKMLPPGESEDNEDRTASDIALRIRFRSRTIKVAA